MASTIPPCWRSARAGVGAVDRSAQRQQGRAAASWQIGLAALAAAWGRRRRWSRAQALGFRPAAMGLLDDRPGAVGRPPPAMRARVEAQAAHRGLASSARWRICASSLAQSISSGNAQQQGARRQRREVDRRAAISQAAPPQSGRRGDGRSQGGRAHVHARDGAVDVGDGGAAAHGCASVAVGRTGRVY